MNSKLESYRMFHEAAITLSFSQAAKNLYISQSAISQAMKQLELELDCKLFVRGGKGVSLTKDGTLLYTYVHDALELVGTAEKKLSEQKTLTSGTLVIGAGDTISSQYLLPYLEQFHNLYPKVKIQMINRTSLEMLELIKKEKVDVAFVNTPMEDEAISLTNCLEVHDIFVCGNKYKDAKKSYSFSDIAQTPLILLEANSNSRRYIDECFAKEHIHLLPQIEIGAHELLLQLARINLGVSCVIKEFSKDFLDAGYVYEMPLKKALPARYIACATLRKNPASAAVSKLLDLLQ